MTEQAAPLEMFCHNCRHWLAGLAVEPGDPMGRWRAGPAWGECRRFGPGPAPTWSHPTHRRDTCFQHKARDAD